MKKSSRICLLSAVLAFFVGCGGGGGGGGGSSGSGTLTVSGKYPSSATVALYTNGTITPQITGLQGHAPNCSVASGTLPPGMKINSDCSVTGIPLAAGIFSFTARLGASGVSNTLDFSGVISVKGPTPSYSGSITRPDNLAVGVGVNKMPDLGWTLPSGLAATTLFTVESGQLPPGLSLNAASGAIAGTVTTTGSYVASIKLTMTTSYGIYTSTGSYYANTSLPQIAYQNTGDPMGWVGGSAPYLVGYVSQPFQASPIDAAAGGFSLNGVPLPAGLTLDPVTGVVSGTPQVVAAPNFGGIDYPVVGTIGQNGVSVSTTGKLVLRVEAPVEVSYTIEQFAQVGVATSVSPKINRPSPVPTSGATFAYAPRADRCSLPPGITLNPISGIVSGTPTTAGTYSCYINTEITNNGVTWTSWSQVYYTVR